jgi:hypothetical protein
MTELSRIQSRYAVSISSDSQDSTVILIQTW